MHDMPKPICFVVMPFGDKETRAPAPAPAKIKFDALWEKALGPAIAALGYDAVRADQDLGALIISEMLERLYFSDLVIADMTIPNGNVYYEVGIRHAAKDLGCVLIGADWATPLFDVKQMRQIQYALPDGDVSDATAAVIHATLVDVVPKLATGISPMYQTLDGYPSSVKTGRATSIRQYLAELSSFQGAARAVRLASSAERRTRALALRDKYASTPPLVPAVALEVLYVLRDYADWTDVLGFIETLPADLVQLPVVREQRCLAQSKTGNHVDAIAALQELVATAGATSERYGLIGGRFKKLANQATDPRVKRDRLNQAIDAYEQGMQADLNDYYPSSNLPRLYRQRGDKGDPERARGAAAVAVHACERSLKLNPADEWVRPTLLGMAFDAGSTSKAEELAAQVTKEGAAAWKLQTTLDDLQAVVNLQDDPKKKDRLQDVLTTLKTQLPAEV
jgi:tetratricopeptide (TPR) repeat protein